MERIKTSKNIKQFECSFCDFKCSKKGDYNRHLSTSKHKRNTNGTEKTSKNITRYTCSCGKTYKVASGLWKHKKNCSFVNNQEDKTIVKCNNDHNSNNAVILDVISQNKELMNLLLLQQQETKELMDQNKIMQNTIQEMVPKIGNTNITNNNFNLNVFLNEDCKDALNFSEFIDTMKISFEDLENQAENGYIKGISKLFIDNLQELGTHKRPIHCTDKKRKTLYIKENNEWDKEGSRDSLKKGIQEVTRKTQEKLLEEKEINSEEYKDSDSKFFEKCITIQRNLIPSAPRETTINKVMENISNKSGIVEK
jgi:hypothetical protein